MPVTTMTHAAKVETILHHGSPFRCMFCNDEIGQSLARHSQPSTFCCVPCLRSINNVSRKRKQRSRIQSIKQFFRIAA